MYAQQQIHIGTNIMFTYSRSRSSPFILYYTNQLFESLDGAFFLPVSRFLIRAYFHHGLAPRAYAYVAYMRE